jgi:TolB protein
MEEMNYSKSNSVLLIAIVGWALPTLAATCLIVGCSRGLKTPEAISPKPTEVSGRIAFVANQSGNWELWTINADGTNPVQLTQTPLDERFPAWAPDGQTIVYSTSDGNLWTIHADGTQMKSLLLNIKEKERRDNTHPVWSPDGRKIAFVSFLFDQDDSEIWLINSDGSHPIELVAQNEIQINPTWSPDSRGIIYSSTIYGPAGKIIQDLWVVQSDGRNAKRMLANDAANFHADLSPDGKKLAFTSDKSGNMDIWLFELQTQNLIQLTHHDAYDADPSWALDSQHLAFVSNRTGAMQIWIMDITGQNLRQLTNMPGVCKEPAWSKMTGGIK